MRSILFIFLTLLFASCDTSGVKTKKKKAVKQEVKKPNILDQEHKVVEELKMDNGIFIQWFEKGTGDKFVDGDLIQIDYKVKLNDGTVVDGNHLIKKEKKSLPFLIGFGMQTPGWDIALKELRVGDFVQIVIPARLARGDKGIKGLIPPNADNLLVIRVLKKETPTRIVDGTKVWLLEENKSNKMLFNEKTEISFHGIASSPSKPMYVNTYSINQPFKYRLSDYGLIPGLRKALINAKKADRLYIVVPSSEAYGAKGYLNIVKPNENVFYNILVMDVTKI